MGALNTGQAAIEYAQRGLAVFPLIPKGKKPSCEHGFKDATKDVQAIEQWWSKRQSDNVGLACGEVSGNIGVIDIDFDAEEGKDGYKFLEAWEREYGQLPKTWTVKTARGGKHLYYRFEGETPCNSANEQLAIDFRGEGGYVMAPPSVHPNGKRVEWETSPDEIELAWADDNVKAFVTAIRPQNTKEGQRFVLPEVIRKGERDNTLFRYACSLQAQGVDDSQISNLVHEANNSRCEQPLPTQQVEQKIRGALLYPKGQPSGLVQASKLASPYLVALDLTKGGSPDQTLNNCVKVLEQDLRLTGHFVYNEMAYRPYIKFPLPWDESKKERPQESYDTGELACFLEKEYGLRSIKKAETAIEVVSHRHNYNPITEWLDSLVWDGDEMRVPCLFANFLGAECGDYEIEVARLTLRAAVARVYNPGCKFDYMPVLIGKQGTGKSSFVSRLAMRPEWYLGNLNTFEGDSAVEKIQGKWIIEVEELAAMKRQKDQETIKAFISTTTDTIRTKYTKYNGDRPRVCILIGTTNNNSFLSDKTGNRRYLPIDVGVNEHPFNSLDMPDEYFEQCWAQAVAEYKKDPAAPLIMPSHVAPYTQAALEKHVEEDSRVGIIQEWLDNQKELSKPGEILYVCVPQICDKALGMQSFEYQGKRAVSNQIHEIMTHQIKGWEKAEVKHKINGYGAQWCYTPASDS